MNLLYTLHVTERKFRNLPHLALNLIVNQYLPEARLYDGYCGYFDVSVKSLRPLEQDMFIIIFDPYA